MNLKRIALWPLLFLSFSTVASAQQAATKADLQALELNLTKQMADMDKRLTGQIADLDKQIISLEITVKEMDKRLTSRIDVLFWAIGALIGVVLAVIALPQLLGYFQEKRARTDFQKQIEVLEQRIEQQQQEIEELKSRKLIVPS